MERRTEGLTRRAAGRPAGARGFGMGICLAAALAGGLALSLFLAGCGDDNPSGTEQSDEEVLGDMITGDDSEFAEWFDLGGFLGEDSTGLRAPLLPVPLSPMHTAFWWREPVLPFVRTIEATVVGDSAFVRAVTDIHGTLHIFEADDPTPVDTPKDFADRAEQLAVFKRYADSTQAFRRGWRLEEISDVEIVSQPSATVVIDSVRLAPAGGGAEPVEYWIRDPLALEDRGEIPRFLSGVLVEVTVYTSGSPVLGYLHTGRGEGHRRRFPLETEDGAVFHGVLLTPLQPGIHQCAVDLVSEATLGDPEAPYDSNAWLIVYGSGVANPD